MRTGLLHQLATDVERVGPGATCEALEVEADAGEQLLEAARGRAAASREGEAAQCRLGTVGRVATLEASFWNVSERYQNP